MVQRLLLVPLTAGTDLGLAEFDSILLGAFDGLPACGELVPEVVRLLKVSLIELVLLEGLLGVAWDRIDELVAAHAARLVLEPLLELELPHLLPLLGTEHHLVSAPCVYPPVSLLP